MSQEEKKAAEGGFIPLNSKKEKSKEDERRNETQSEGGQESQSEEVQEVQRKQDKEGVQAQEEVTKETSSEVEQPEKETETGQKSEEVQSEDEVSDNEESEVESEIAPVANLLKERGALPEDFEVTDDLTTTDLEDAVVDYYKSIGTGEALSEKLDELKKYGVDETTAQINKIKSYGVSDEELNKFQAYKKVGSYEFDQEAENFEDQVKQLGHDYFRAKGFSEEEVPDYVETDLEKKDPEELLQKYQGFFKSETENLQNTINSKVEQGRKQEEEQEKKETERLKKTLEKGEVDGKKYSKEDVDYVKKFMFEKTEKVKDEHGNIRRVTPLYKLQQEMKKNPERELRVTMDIILGHDKSTIEDQARKKEKRSQLHKLNKFTKEESEEMRKTPKDKEKTAALFEKLS